MPLQHTTKSEKKKKKNTKKPEVSEVQSESGEDVKKTEVTPVKKQLEEQRQKQKVREMEEKLKALVQQRKAVEEKLRRARSAIVQRAGVPNPNLRKVNFLKTYLETVKSCYAEYNGFQNDIYALPLSEEQKVEHEGKYEEFEMLYHGLVIELSDLLDAVSKPVANAALVPVPPANVAVPNYIPPLNVPLPKFDGSFETWYSFKSMFQNIMARYTNEAPAIKLYHLRDALVGKAAGVIDQELVNNNDYDAAWAVLEELYEDKRAIIDRHIDNLFAMPNITRDNAAELRSVIDVCVKNVEALKVLKLPVNGLGEQMLVNLLASRMDNETRRAWEANQKAGELPTYESTITFLKEKRRVAEKLERVESNSTSADSEKPKRSVALVIASNTRCSVCLQDHELEDCERFKQKTVNERYCHLRKCGMCFSCFRKGHRAAACTRTKTCQLCSKRHHTLLHTDGTKKPETASNMMTAEAPKQTPRIRSKSGMKQTLLSTAVVLVYDRNGEPQKCRALIDSCSQNHFITDKCANLLELKRERADCGVSGLNGGVTRISHLVRTKVKSRVTPFSAELEMLVTPRIIEDMPPEAINITNWNLPAELELADPNFHSRGQIDLLLGAELFWDLIKAGKITLAENQPSLRETELGWVVGGALSTRTSAAVQSFCGVIKLAPRI